MTDPTRFDRTNVFVSDDGEELTFAQIARASAKEQSVDVEQAEGGYLFDGKLYTPKASE